MTFLMIKQVLD